MLESMKPCDLLPGMVVTARNGATGTVKICSVRFDGLLPIMIDDYTNDLFSGDWNNDEENDLDIMRVTLPSGAVLWEREEVEVRAFDISLLVESLPGIDINCRLHAPWISACAGKLCTFKPSSAEQGLCNGYSVARAWTRALTDEERKTWGKRK